MIDEAPSTKLAVYLFLEMIALGFVLEAVSALMRGAEWWKWAGAFAVGIIFMVLGVKSGAIIDGCSHWVNWRLWGKRIAIAVQALLVTSLIALIGIGYYEWHRLSLAFRSFAPAPLKHQAPATAQAPVSAPVKSKLLDWTDKQNWRSNLHTGMTRSQVQKLFGPPETMSVTGDLEFWHYGDGEIAFDMGSYKDGGLYSWREPPSN